MKPVVSRTATPDPGDDSILRRLTREDRAKLSMDSWEPSLLRHLMKAQNKLSGGAAPSAESARKENKGTKDEQE